MHSLLALDGVADVVPEARAVKPRKAARQQRPSVRDEAHPHDAVAAFELLLELGLFFVVLWVVSCRKQDLGGVGVVRN